MKKLTLLLTILLLAIASVSFAQAASATIGMNTPAVEAPASTFLDKALALLAFVFAALLTALAAGAKKFVAESMQPLLTSWLKDSLHFRGSSVIADDLGVVLTETSKDVIETLKDGSVSKKEIAWIIERVKLRSIPKLENLALFYKKNLDAWVEDQVTVQLGKLLSLNSSNSVLKIR